MLLLRSLLHSGVPVFLAVVAVSVFGLTPRSSQAATITWDGGGSDALCGGAVGSGNNWSCGLNWSTNTVPGVNDVATFNGTSTKNANLDTNTSVQGIDINSGYSGTITQNSGVTVTVGTGDFDISAGAFVGGDASIDINDAFTVSGGTFTATSGTMSVAGNFTVSSGTFNDGSGTVVADGPVSTWNVVTSESFNHLTISKSANNAFHIASGDTLVVNGTLNLTDGVVNTGTFDARGDVNQASTLDGGTATVLLGNDSVNQTYTINGGSGPNIKLDASADANDHVVLAANASLSSFVVTSGFSGNIPFENSGNFVPSFALWSQAAGDLDASATSDWNVTAMTISGGTLVAPQTITANGISGNWDLNSSQTVENLVVNRTSAMTLGANDTLVVNGDLTLTNGTINTASGTVDVRGNVTQGSGFDGGSASLVLGDDAVAQDYTINGGVSPVLKLDAAADADDDYDVTAAATFNGFVATSGFSGTAPLNNASDYALTFNALTVGGGTLDASAQSAWTLNGDLSVSGSGSFVAPALITAGGSTGSWDVSTSQEVQELVINRTSATTLGANDTLIVNGDLTLTNGTVNPASGTVAVRGDVTQASTFDGGAASVVFDNSAAAQIYAINGGVSPVLKVDSADDASDDIDVNVNGVINGLTSTSGFSGTVPLNNPSDFTLTLNALTVGGGTLDASAQSAWNLAGDLTVTGGSFLAPALVTASATTGTWDVNGSQSLNALTVNRTSATNIAANDVISVSGDLTLTNGTLQSASGVVEALANAVVGFGWDGGSAALRFSGSANQSFDLTSATSAFNGDVRVNKTGGQVSLASALVMDASGQDLVVEEGTLKLNGQNLTVNGSGSTLVVQDGGVISLIGSETVTKNAGQPNLQAGSTIEFTGDADSTADTYTITNFATTYGNLLLNAADGNTEIFALGAALDVNGNLTITAGTLDVTTSNYAITLGGNWVNNGAFTAQSGTVTLDGGNQAVSGATTFNNFTKAVTSAATLTLDNSSTQTFLGTLTLKGATDGMVTELLSVRSSSSGNAAAIDPQGSVVVEYLDVQDSNNVSATAIACSTGCVDSGNNTNWTF